ncbi:MAG: hypothetical protein OJF62_003411 [Pseudolabrys sp.]|nr:hypothetical protein [Pseudolabrys sp.]
MTFFPSSPAQAGDPVEATLAAQAETEITGCPAFAGHDGVGVAS